MKIKQSDFDELKVLMETEINFSNNPNNNTPPEALIDFYKRHNMSHVRYAWDMFWRATTEHHEIRARLYKYLSDCHIETAIKKIAIY